MTFKQSSERESCPPADKPLLDSRRVEIAGNYGNSDDDLSNGWNLFGQFKRIMRDPLMLCVTPFIGLFRTSCSRTTVRNTCPLTISIPHKLQARGPEGYPGKAIGNKLQASKFKFQ